MSNPKTISSLTSVQKEAIALLSIGTFLEYFDLMLYVHMAVLLNELFFPPSDPFTASLLSALAFSSTYVLRPFGALIFGYIGDNVGRKATVIITTTMMSISCFIMANLPTHAQIGVSAAWIITICRMVQGLSTMGEVIGANIYITEITKPPVQYPAVMLMAIFGTLGGTAALGVASMVTSYGFNWRMAFLIGAGVALVGGAARTRLRETPDFANAKLRVKKALENTKQDLKILKKNVIWNEKVSKKTALSLFFIECSWPVCFYLAYIYCGNILKNSFGLSAEEVIHQNFTVSSVQFVSWLVVGYLSYKIYPLKILKVKLILFSIFVVICPYLLDVITTSGNSTHILMVQIFVVTFGIMGTPAMPIFYKRIPIFKRFTFVTFAYALSRAFIYIVTSFGFAYSTNYLSHWGILVVIVPISIAYAYGLHHFQTTERVNSDRLQKGLENQEMIS